MNAGMFVLLLSVASVYSQPDLTACDNGGAYDTSKGVATCGGMEVNFFDLVCGKGFSQQSCVAKWTNPGSGDEEDYFFMGAGAGIAVSDLPASCSKITITTPLAMVQYYPNGGCYPAADLQGTQASYTPSGDGKSIQSVTLTFAEHDDGTAVRDGYMKITCGNQTSGFTTNGDTDVQSKYEVQVTAPCSSAPGPSPSGPPAAKGGIDDGGILLIVFFASLISYFGIGFVVMWKVKNAEGMERVPHKEFWLAQVGNVKEGFRFIKSKVTRTDYAPI